MASSGDLNVGDGTRVFDDEAKPPVPPRTKTDTLTALPTASAADAPLEQEMSRLRSDVVDPVRVLSGITVEQMREAKTLDMADLADFFKRLGLREIPQLIVRNQLNGSVLHTITEADVDKMDFHSLGEAKAFLNLCIKMSQIDRGDQREEAIMVRKLVFWGNVHEWHTGPCEKLNRCSMKDRRNSCDRCWDALCCRRKELVTLPESSVILYRDHLSISQPLWIESTVQKKYHELNKAFANPNVSTFKRVIDNIDYSNIVDVDLESKPKVGDYHRSCADCGHFCCGHQLRREPDLGNFYWVTPFQRCFGYTHVYKERPDGIITIKLRRADDRGQVRHIGVVDGAQALTRTLLHYVEESQIKKGLRVT